MIEELGLRYRFVGGYVRRENLSQLAELLDRNGQMSYFNDIRTVVGEFGAGGQVFTRLSDTLLLQNATADAYRYTFMDSLRLKSIETALGYSNVQMDIYRVLQPKDETDQWENLAEKMTQNIDTYWKPFSAFEKTTVGQSDERVRSFLNGRVRSEKAGDCISITTEGFSGNAYLLLRTHGEIPVQMTGGSFQEVEKDAYLLTLTEETATVTLLTETELYYQMDS